MQVVFYSCDLMEKNTIIDEELKTLLDAKSTITYLNPPKNYPGTSFENFTNWYAGLGYTNIQRLNLNDDYDFEDVEKALSRDVIFLPDSNAYALLSVVLKRNFNNQLIGFVKKGGVLIGASAGAMVISASIGASAEENEVGVDPDEALGIVDFEFLPHYEEENTIDNILLERSKTRNVIACKDGDGLIIWDDDKYIIGEPVFFFLGNRELLERF